MTQRGPAVLAVAGVVIVAFNMRTAIASVPPLLDDLDLTGAAPSLLVTIPVLCFATGALMGPRVRARLGEERAIFALLATTVAGILLRAAWPDAALFLGTVIAGIGLSGINVLLPSLIKRRFRDHVGPLTAAYVTALNVGGGVAAGLTVPIMHSAGGDPGLALAVWALPALVALVLWVPQLRLPGGPVRGVAVRRGDARAIWRQPLAWLVMLFMGLQSVSFYGPLSWLPAILRDSSIDAAKAGALLGVMLIVSMVGSTISPVVAARRADQRAVMAVSVGSLTIGVTGLLLAPGAALLWTVLMGLGQGACFGLALLLMNLRAADGEAAAQLSSMAQAGGYAIAAAGPLIMGVLHGASGGWTLPLLFLLLVAAVELLVGLGASRDRLVHREHAMS